ncbi:anti-sigma factor [Synechococcus sp. PCC 7336]|uniref:anti-sigma factor family protein n=1 Tax=Synechococcus sp. PCC 7336 TaxID=195250 RepID=UPI0003457A5B|nr:zf-HC2 domain-containing protein [Synechococcus sp. PCC 7336]
MTERLRPDGSQSGSSDLYAGDRHLSADEQWELLSAYLDGELEAAERQQVEVWLADNSDLRQAYRQLQQLQQQIEHLPVPASSPQMAERVLAQLDRSPSIAFVPTRLLRQGVRVAAGAIVLLAGAAVWQATRPPVLMVSLEEAPVVIPEPPLPFVPESVAQSYLLIPSADRDAYAILLADS